MKKAGFLCSSHPCGSSVVDAVVAHQEEDGVVQHARLGEAEGPLIRARVGRLGCGLTRRAGRRLRLKNWASRGVERLEEFHGVAVHRAHHLHERLVRLLERREAKAWHARLAAAAVAVGAIREAVPPNICVRGVVLQQVVVCLLVVKAGAKAPALELLGEVLFAQGVVCPIHEAVALGKEVVDVFHLVWQRVGKGVPAHEAEAFARLVH